MVAILFPPPYINSLRLGDTCVCVSKSAIIKSGNDLLPIWHQAITWPSAELLSIWPLEINFSQILTKIQTFSFKKMPVKMSSGKWRPFCPSLNVLNGVHSAAITRLHPGRLAGQNGSNLQMVCLLPLCGSLLRTFLCAPSQWETTLHCNVVSHWLGAHTQGSLHLYTQGTGFLELQIGWGELQSGTGINIRFYLMNFF